MRLPWQIAEIWNDGPEFEEFLGNPDAPPIARRHLCYGGGKGGTSTTQNFSSGNSSVSIPPEVMARYNAVNQRAEQAASQPFQDYGGEFVAPVNSTQQGGINTIAGSANSWQPSFGQAYGSLAQGFGAAYPALQQGQNYGTGLGLAGLNIGQQGFNSAQPYNAAAGNLYGGATGLAVAGTNAVNPTALTQGSISQYLNPGESAVIDPVVAQMQNVFGQQQRDLTGNQILSGNFGTDRGGIGKATLANQQNLALGQTLSGLYNQNYQTALQTAQGQQQLGLGAAQANRAALQQGASSLTGIGQAQQGLGQQVFGQGQGLAGLYGTTGANLFGQGNTAAGTYGNLGLGAAGAYQGLGTGNLQNALTQGQAQIGAGTVQQQTQQAQDTALYNQFLQQQGYPFQVAQFLAGIAEGTGALSGSTTTSSGTSSGSQYSPQPFFSDERLKEDVEEIGRTHDGQKIVRFRYKGSPHTQLGLIAQDVAKKHPEAVGNDNGFLTVDYDAATRRSVKRADGGLVPRMAMEEGGSPYDMSGILAAQRAMYPGAINARGIGSGPRGMQLAPSGGLQMIQGPKVDLPKAEFAKQPEQTGLGDTLKGINTATEGVKDIGSLVHAGSDALVGSAGHGTPGTPGYAAPTGGLVGSGGSFSNPGWFDRHFGSASGSTPSASSSITATALPPPDSPSAGPQAPAGMQPDATSSTGVAPTPIDVPADTGTTVSGLDASSNIADAANDNDLFSGFGALAARRGGRIRRAVGGNALPYDNVDSYVPESDQPNVTQLLANQKGMQGPAMQAPEPSKPQGSGGSSTFGDLLKTAGTVASIVAMFERGGRVERKLGGVAGMVSGQSKPVLLDLVNGDTKDLPDDALASVGMDGLAGGLIPLRRGGRASGLRPALAGGGDPDDVINPGGDEPVVSPDAEVKADVARESAPTSLKLPVPVPEAKPSGVAPAAPPAGPAAPQGVAPAPAPAPAPRPTPTVPTAAPAPAKPTPEQMQYMLDRSEHAVSTWESNPDPNKGWDTVGPATKYADGTVDRPYGKYGVMGDNVPGWTKQWYGKPLTPQEFLNNPDAQRAVFRGQFGQYINQYGTPQKAAGAWFAGPGGLNSNAQDVLKTSVPWYMKRFTALYNGDPDPGARDPNAQPGGDLQSAGPAIGGGASGLLGPRGLTGYDPYTGRAQADPNAGFFDHGGWLDRNQKEIASGLAFLGNMLASPSRTLAGSVGTGLAAAAPMFLKQANTEQELGQRQQQLGQSQQRIDIATYQQLMAAYAQVLQRQQGYIRQFGHPNPELDQLANNIMHRIGTLGGAPTNVPTGTREVTPGGGGVPAPGAGSTGGVSRTPLPAPNGTATAPPSAPTASAPKAAPSTTPGTTPTVAPQTTDTGQTPPDQPTNADLARKYALKTPQPDPGWYAQIDPLQNPLEWERKADEQAAHGLDSTYERQQAQHWNQVLNEQHFLKGVDGSNVYVPNWQQFEGGKHWIADNQKYAETEGQNVQNRRTVRQALDDMQNIAERFKSGGLREAQAEIGRVSDALGVPLPNFNAQDQTAEYEKFLKNAWTAALQRSGTTGHDTDAMREQIAHITPGPEMQPSANRSIMAQMRALIDDADRQYRDFQEGYQLEPGLNRGAYMDEVNRRPGNDIQTLKKKYENENPVLGDVPGQRKGLVDNKVYLVTPDDMKKLNPGLTDQQVYKLFGDKPSLKFRAFKKSDGSMGLAPMTGASHG